MSAWITKAFLAPLTAVSASLALGIPEHVPLVALSGLCGGLSRALALGERLYPDAVRSMALGTLAATFLWPLVEPLVSLSIGRLAMENSTELMFGGYVAGLSGVAMIGIVLDVVQMRHKRLHDDRKREE